MALTSKQLTEGKWYKFYPYLNYHDDRVGCQWWMKAEGENSSYATKYISWFNLAGERLLRNERGCFPGNYTFEEATPHEAHWLGLVEEGGAYFPMPKVPEIINNYSIY